MARRKQPDLIVLDLLLPELDGTDVCRLLRGGVARPDHHAHGPQHRRRQARGSGHRRGRLPDQAVQPARTGRARARGPAPGHAGREPVSDDVRFGDLTISFVRHEVMVEGQAGQPDADRVPAAGDAGHAIPAGRSPAPILLDRAFGYDYDGVERTVDVHIMNLRRKIEPAAIGGTLRRCRASATVSRPGDQETTGSRTAMWRSLRFRLLLATILVVHHRGRRHRVCGHAAHARASSSAMWSGARPFDDRRLGLLPRPLPTTRTRSWDGIQPRSRNWAR